MKLLKSVSYILIILGILIIILIKVMIISNKEYQYYVIEKNNVNYINIPSINVNNILIDGITDEHLNMNYATIEVNNNIIVAGHAIELVFKNLYNIEIDDEIIIYYNNQLLTYYVIDKYNVNTNEFNGFDQINKLILITCIDKDNRLIVVAKK